MIVPTLPTRTQLALPVEPPACRRRRSAARTGSQPEVRGRRSRRRPARPTLSFRPAVGVADHQRVEAGPGHHREVLAVDDARGRALAGRRAARSATASPRSLRDAEVGGQQVRRAGGKDRDVDAGPARASMQRCTMPSPPHTKTRSAPFSTASPHACRRLLALGHLEPERARCPRRPGRCAARRARRRGSSWRGRPRRRWSSCDLLRSGRRGRATTNGGHRRGPEGQGPEQRGRPVRRSGSASPGRHGRRRRSHGHGGHRPPEDPPRPAPPADAEQHGDAEPQDEGGGDVTGREAVGAGLATQLRDVGRLPADDVVGGEEDRQLEGEGERYEQEVAPPPRTASTR